MVKTNLMTWREALDQYRSWLDSTDLQTEIENASFGQVSLDALYGIFGKEAVFADAETHSVGVYLGSYGILFHYEPSKRSCTRPSTIVLPENIGEARQGLRNLYIAIVENFVGHVLGKDAVSVPTGKGYDETIICSLRDAPIARTSNDRENGRDDVLALRRLCDDVVRVATEERKPVEGGKDRRHSRAKNA